MSTLFETLLQQIKRAFDLMHEKDDEQHIIAYIRAGVNFRGANTWILVFAIFMASLGLNVNSTAVIIGAMLISPLMGPIIGIGLAVGINDFDLLKDSYRNLAIATLISILTATLYFLITPINEAQSELLARTSPTIYDVLIALFGGAAGIVAVSMRGNGGNVIPGVAIATALMPPLCTAGYGVAMGNWGYFLGAFYLFFINTVFICLSTYLGVRLMKFRYKQQIDSARFKQVRKYIFAVVVLTMVPAVYFTFRIARDSLLESQLQRFAQTELQQQGTLILSTHVDAEAKSVSVVAVGREISDSMQHAAQKQLSDYRLDGYALHLIQGTQSDSLLTAKKQQPRSGLMNEKRQLAEQEAQIASLEARLDPYRKLRQLTKDVAHEVPSLFPAVATLSIAQGIEARTDTAATAVCVQAIVTLHRGAQLSVEQRRMLQSWLRVRTATDSMLLRVVSNE